MPEFKSPFRVRTLGTPARSRPSGNPSSAHSGLGPVLILGLLAGSGLGGCKTSGSESPSTSKASAAASASGEAPASAASGPTSGPASVPGSAAEAQPAAHLGEATLDQAQALERANAALDQGDVRAAVQALEEVVAGPPSAARTSALLALAHTLESTDPAAAGRWYGRLLAEAPDVPEAHFAAGRFRAGHDDVKGAMAAFRDALTLQPDLLPVYPLLGALLVQSGAKDEAAALYLTYERRLEALTLRVQGATTPMGEKLPVIELFGLLDDERAQTALTALLEDPLPEIRVAAASALAEAGEPESLSAIAKAAVAEKDGVARQLLTQVLARARRRVAEAPP